MTLHVDFKNMKHVIGFGFKFGAGLVLGSVTTGTAISIVTDICGRRLKKLGAKLGKEKKAEE